jgi:hypothetical protein
MGTRRVYDRLTASYVISFRARLIVRIRKWKEDVEKDKKRNQTHSDDRDNHPFDSRHYAPLSYIIPEMSISSSL